MYQVHAVHVTKHLTCDALAMPSYPTNCVHHTHAPFLDPTQALARALKCFQKCDGLKSELLLALIDPTRWADMDSSLQELSDAADWGEAETSGRVVPSKGADEGFDAACEAVQAAEQALQVWSLPLWSWCSVTLWQKQRTNWLQSGVVFTMLTIAELVEQHNMLVQHATVHKSS